MYYADPNIKVIKDPSFLEKLQVFVRILHFSWFGSCFTDKICRWQCGITGLYGGIWVYFTDPDKYMFILKTHIFCYTTGLSKIMYLSQFNVFNTLT